MREGMVRRRTLRALLARLALAYLLVVQAVLGGAVTGLRAAPGPASPAAMLCSGGMGGPAGPAGDGSAHATLCCILGCMGGAAQPLLAPGRAAFAPPPPRIRAARFEPAAGAVVDPLLRFAFDATGPPSRV